MKRTFLKARWLHTSRYCIFHNGQWKARVRLLDVLNVDILHIAIALELSLALCGEDLLRQLMRFAAPNGPNGPNRPT